MDISLRQIIALIVRVAGTGVVAWLAAKGQISTDEATATLIMALVIIVNVVWSAVQKLGSNKAVTTALELPAGTDLDTLKKELKFRAKS